MIPRSFYFLRHGETDWNKEERMQGWTDIPLNDTGRAQAQKSVPAFSGLQIDLVVTSPLQRAKETAEIINSTLQKPLLVDTRLRERGFGILEGMLWGEADAWRENALAKGTAPIEENGYPVAPNAETYETFKQRTVASVTEHLGNHLEKNILFVAHGGIYRVLRRILLGSVDQTPNAQPWHFRKMTEGWQIEAVR